MIFRRHLCVLLTIGCCWLARARAQENTGGAAAPGGGASSAFGSSAPGTGETAPGAGGSSTFGARPPGTGPAPEPGTKKTGAAAAAGTGENGNATGAASAFGDGQTPAKKPADAEATFTIPGGYGKPAQQFTAGEGRLARPKFRYTGSVQFGYDDNVFQAPTTSGSPDTVVTVLASPAIPARMELGIGPNGETQTVTVPGTGAKTRKVVIAGQPGQPRIGSFLARANVGFDVQFASRKTLFTFDIRTGADVYWDRPGKDVDYTGSAALMYLRRLTPRLQFTANVGASYQTQPDLTLVNTSTRQAGSFLNANSKIDLSYRFTPRISVVTSASYNTVRYEVPAQQFGDYGETVFGTELRYLFSPRLTLLGEVRYSSISYATTSARDSHTLFLLLGGEVTLSRRFSSTVRLGANLRSFNEGGGSATSPYGELTLNYQLAKATIVRFNGRYGFEEPPDARSKLVSLRSGLSLVQSFSPRLRGTLGVNYVRQTTTTTPVAPTTPQAASAVTATFPEVTASINTVDSTIGFEYNVNRNWTLNANYSYSREFGTNSLRDYYRNRIFVGAAYDF